MALDDRANAGKVLKGASGGPGGLSKDRQSAVLRMHNPQLGPRLVLILVRERSVALNKLHRPVVQFLPAWYLDRDSP
jgi:hypothetical protein